VVVVVVELAISMRWIDQRPWARRYWLVVSHRCGWKNRDLEEWDGWESMICWERGYGVVVVVHPVHVRADN
jgi:hypothetical protein